MTRFLDRIHARLGDFWWYSLMIFCAMRAADALNVFVGLWLVPKYVEPSELGAVMPLIQFANCLAIPAAVFAATFRQELSGLAVRGEFGKMKSLMRGVFVTTVVFLVLALAVSRLVLPQFLSRIRIAEGSLGIVILAASFTAAVSPVYTNAIQTLRKFTAYSWINVLSAPVRLVTMLALMPFRALTGYFVGQAATPAFSIAASLVALRRELARAAEPYWTGAIARRFARLFAIFGINAAVTGLTALVEATAVRQCLPDLESAAYYLVTRFGDMASILSTTLLFTIFPFAAELAARGRDTRPLILKCIGATALFCAALGGFFALSGETILRFLPHGAQYAAYAWAIPASIAYVCLAQCGSFYTTARTAANRFGYLLWSLPLHLGYVAALWLAARHGAIRSLGQILVWMLTLQLVRLACTFIAMARRP